MATAATATKEKATAAEVHQAHPLPAETGKSPPPATRAERLAADAGKGVSKDQSDKFVPMVKILQSQSPQCLRQRPEYVPGAEAGDFYMKNTLTPVIRGSEGIEFIPCAFMKCWLEFDGPRDEKPNFVGRHGDLPGGRPDVPASRGLKLDEEDGYDYIDANGHRYTYSREHYGLVDGKPFVMPFGGSGHTTSKEWQTLMDQFRLRDGRVEPSFNHKYKLTTVPRSNKSGDWFAVNVAHIGEVSDEEYELGHRLHEAVEGGTKVAEVPERDAGEVMAEKTAF